jgi:ATP-binding cassette subfamily B protein
MKEIIKLFWEFFHKDPWFVITNVAFSILIPIQDVLLPHLYGNVISAIEKKKNLLRPFLIVIILLVIIQVGYVVSDWHDTKLFPKMQTFIRQNMLNSIFKNYETQYQDLFLGDLMSKFIKIPMHLTQWFERLKNYILPYILAYILAIIYFMWNDLLLGIFLAILLIIYVYLVVGAPSFCKRRAILKDTAQNNLHEEIDDTLRNLISVYGGEQQEEEFKRLDIYEEKYRKAYESTMICALTTRAYVTPIVIGFLIIFCYRCGIKIKNRTMDTSRFVPLFIILLYLLSSMMNLTDQVRDMIFEVGIISNFEEMFSYKHISKNTDIPDSLIIPQQGLYLYDVSFSYSSTLKPTISHLNLYINNGDRICIVGEIGSGKSTILKLLLKLHEPNYGTIFLNGASYNNIPVKNIRKIIGYVPQQPILFNRSILENIKYSNPHVDDEYIINLLYQLNLSEAFLNLSEGLNTKIGKNGSKISGGQRQLIWSLRILLHNPDILILDEPTASLDEKTKSLLIRLYEHFMTDKTIIMVTHDQTLMKYAKRMIVMDSGKIVNDYYVK